MGNGNDGSNAHNMTFGGSCGHWSRRIRTSQLAREWLGRWSRGSSRARKPRNPRPPTRRLPSKTLVDNHPSTSLAHRVYQGLCDRDAIRRPPGSARRGWGSRGQPERWLGTVQTKTQTRETPPRPKASSTMPSCRYAPEASPPPAPLPTSPHLDPCSVDPSGVSSNSSLALRGDWL